MTVIDTGSTIDIYSDNEIKTSEKIPSGTYKISFHKMRGFFLEKNPSIKVEEKIYGNLQSKVNKAFNSFKNAKRNNGVILSGEKGIGKTVFTNLLSEKCIENDIPVLISTGFIPGINDFINSIQQEVVVIFDEFEKTFKEGTEDNKNGLTSSQEQLLSLFDGQANGKKMFVITCNEVGKLNRFLLNRPGRFHYHFKISKPNENEVREYLTENIKEEYKNTIETIVSLTSFYDFTYDILRAFCFEINQGYSVNETIEDLNFDTASIRKRLYNFSMKTSNGFVFKGCFDLNWLTNLMINPSTKEVRFGADCYYNNKIIEDGVTVFIPQKNILIKNGLFKIQNTDGIDFNFLPCNENFYDTIGEDIPDNVKPRSEIEVGKVLSVEIEEEMPYKVHCGSAVMSMID